MLGPVYSVVDMIRPRQIAALSVIGLMFDNIERIGGHPATILGHPKVIDTPRGKAIQFKGIDDAMFLPVHPLAGFETFTWEVVFRSDSGGAPEQRFFHLEEQDPKTGQDTNTRLLFETRLIDGRCPAYHL